MGLSILKGGPAKCPTCSAPSELRWYPGDEDQDSHWYSALCWRCSEISRMKLRGTMSKLGLGSGGRLSPGQADRFIELAIKQTTVAPELVLVYNPFPWLKPWRWPGWLLWWRGSRVARRAWERNRPPRLEL